MRLKSMSTCLMRCCSGESCSEAAAGTGLISGAMAAATCCALRHDAPPSRGWTSPRWSIRRNKSTAMLSIAAGSTDRLALSSAGLALAGGGGGSALRAAIGGVATGGGPFGGNMTGGVTTGGGPDGGLIVGGLGPLVGGSPDFGGIAGGLGSLVSGALRSTGAACLGVLSLRFEPLPTESGLDECLRGGRKSWSELDLAYGCDRS